jgi:hypothetical protein
MGPGDPRSGRGSPLDLLWPLLRLATKNPEEPNESTNLARNMG